MLASKRDMLRLDPDLLKVLASDRRRDILHHLKKRRMTVTELSKSIGLGKPTVLDHLKRLQDADLIQRHEDERLWVYYSLTDLGRGFVQPSRVPVFLMLGATLLATAAIAVFAAMALGLFASPAPGLEVQVHEDSYLYPGVGGELLLDAPAAQGEPTAWTVGLTDQGPSADKRPELAARLDAVGTAPVHARTTADLAPGTYYLFVADGEGHDNRARMPAVVVPRMEAVGVPSQWWRGLDGDLHVTVLADGSPVEGALRFLGDGPALHAGLEGGRATFPATALDARSGTQGLVYMPLGQDVEVPLDRVVTVQEPVVEVVPRVVAEGAAQFLVEVRSAADATSGPATAPITLDGAPASLQVAGQGTFRVTAPLAAGNSSLQVGRLPAVPVQVLPDLSLFFERNDGGLDLTVWTPAGAVPGAAVRFDGASMGATDPDGRLHMDWPDDGRHQVAVQVPDAPEVARDVVVGGGRLVAYTPAPLVLRAEAFDRHAPAFDVELTNPAAEAQSVSLAATTGDAVFSVRHVVVPADGVVRLGLSGTLAPGAGLEVQAFRAPEPRVGFIDRTLADSSGSSGASGSATHSSSSSSSGSASSSSSDLDTRFDPSFLGVAASSVEDVQVPPLGTSGLSDSGEEKAQSTPALGVVALLVLLAVAARRRVPPGTGPTG